MLETTDQQITTDILTPEPLYSREAEEALVTHVLLHPGDYQAIHIEAGDFYDTRLGELWEIIGRLIRAGKDPDPVALTECWKISAPEEALDFNFYLFKMMSYYVPGTTWENAAAIIRRYAQRRELLRLSGDIARAAYDPKADLPAKNTEFITRLTRASTTGKGAEHWSGALKALDDEVAERAANPKEIWGLPTRFADFDHVTGGLQAGELFILSGKPGVGKSFWAMQTAEQLVYTAPGVIYSLEMSARQVVRRLVSSISGIPNRHLKSGKLADNEWTLFVQAIEGLAGQRVFINDDPTLTTGALRADLARLKATEGIEWFVLDYMMLLNDLPGRDEIEKTTHISKELKMICRQLDLAGLVVHSMNKTGIGKDGRESDGIPDQENLRGSGQVIYNADLICFLTEYRPLTEQEKADVKYKKVNPERMRTLFFGKGRELENPKLAIHYIMLENAKFGEVMK